MAHAVHNNASSISPLQGHRIPSRISTSVQLYGCTTEENGFLRPAMRARDLSAVIMYQTFHTHPTHPTPHKPKSSQKKISEPHANSISRCELLDCHCAPKDLYVHNVAPRQSTEEQTNKRTAQRHVRTNKQTNKRTARRHVRTHGTEHTNRRKTTRHTSREARVHSAQTEGQE